jgi:phage gpG-like protein
VSGVTFSIVQQSDQKVVLYLSAISPRIFANIKQALKLWGYKGANISVTKYFAAGQSVKKGARNTGSILFSRTGTLTRSITASVAPGYSETETTATQIWGAATPYARIQEYGGYAGRNHAAYIPPRPYLGPALNDVRPDLMAAIQEAVDKAIAA